MNPENIEPHKWPEGVSGNPAGKAKGTRNRSTMFREWLELASSTDPNRQVVDDVVLALIQKALLTGDTAAVKEIMDSAYGKTPDKIEQTSKIEINPQDVTSKILAHVPTEALESSLEDAESHPVK